jgi:hypothetical protein
MLVCSRFVFVSLHCQGTFRAEIFVHYCRIGDSGISSAQAAYDNLLASGHRFGVCVHYVVGFALFHGCGWSSSPIFLVVLVRVFPLSILSSVLGDMFRFGEFSRL